MDTLILSHWDMVDCLFDEVYLGKHDDKLHGPEMIEELFRYFASHDPRFNAVGFSWNQRGFYQYTDADGITYGAEGAIAAFLGLERKGECHLPNKQGEMIPARMRAAQSAVNLIWRRFEDATMARVWLRWHVQKMHGYDNKQRDLWKGYPRDFPAIPQQNNELLSQKD